MTQFVYFVPGDGGAAPALLAAIGLGHVGPAASGRIDKGPEAKPGTLVRSTAGGATGRLAFNDLLLWRPEPERRWWLGFDEQAPPGPDDLIRASGTTPGLPVVLGDGREWECPTARDGDGTCRLPMRIGLDAEGKDTFDVIAARAALWAMAGEAWEHAMAEAVAAGEGAETPAGGMTIAKAVEIAAECLATNYRVGVTEVKALGLLTTRNARDVLAALIDWKAFIEMVAAASAEAPATAGKKNDT